MGIDAVAALALGWWYDRAPKAAILTGIALGWLTAPLVFLGGTWGFICGIALWGAGLGMQESVLRAGLTPLNPAHDKGFGVWGVPFREWSGVVRRQLSHGLVV